MYAMCALCLPICSSRRISAKNVRQLFAVAIRMYYFEILRRVGQLECAMSGGNRFIYLFGLCGSFLIASGKKTQRKKCNKNIETVRSCLIRLRSNSLPTNPCIGKMIFYCLFCTWPDFSILTLRIFFVLRFLFCWSVDSR